jgi:hypothetical protein
LYFLFAQKLFNPLNLPHRLYPVIAVNRPESMNHRRMIPVKHQSNFRETVISVLPRKEHDEHSRPRDVWIFSPSEYVLLRYLQISGNGSYNPL